jgi:hypothetical protein
MVAIPWMQYLKLAAPIKTIQGIKRLIISGFSYRLPETEG